MTTYIANFGPWTTSLDAGSRLTLSAFWKRRLRLLPTLGQSRGRRRVEGVALALALALGLIPSIHPVQGDESPVPAQQVVKVQVIVPKGAAEFQYGEVIERTVYDNGHGEYFIDFDSGKVAEEPDDRRFRKSSDLVGWARGEGIDAMGQVSSGYKGLIGFDMIVVPSDSDSWDKRPGGVIESLEFGDPGTPATMDSRAGLPATFFIQTREGSQGVLQIVSVDEDNDRPGPDSIRLRYKPIVKKTQRQIFRPKKDLDASASWNALAETTVPGKGGYMMMANVPVGGVFPVQLLHSDGTTKTLFSVELSDGTDQSLQVNVIPFTEGSSQRWLEGQPPVDPAEMQRLTLQRDQQVDVVIDGEKYSLLFPTVHVGADADPSTIYAQLIVNWRPRSDAAKHGQYKQQPLVDHLAKSDPAVSRQLKSHQNIAVQAPVSSPEGRELEFTGRLLAAAPGVLRAEKHPQKPIAVVFNMDEQSYLNYQRLLKKGQTRGTGDPLAVGLADEHNLPHAGFLDHFDDEFDPNTGAIAVYGVLPNTDDLLLPGMFVRVRMTLGPPAKPQ